MKRLPQLVQLEMVELGLEPSLAAKSEFTVLWFGLECGSVGPLHLIYLIKNKLMPAPHPRDTVLVGLGWEDPGHLCLTGSPDDFGAAGAGTAPPPMPGGLRVEPGGSHPRMCV